MPSNVLARSPEEVQRIPGDVFSRISFHSIPSGLRLLSDLVNDLLKRDIEIIEGMK